MTTKQRQINHAAFQFVEARKNLKPIDNYPIESLSDNLSRERSYIIAELTSAKSYSGQMRVWKQFTQKVYDLLP